MPSATERMPRRGTQAAALAAVAGGLAVVLVLHQLGRVTPTVFADELTYGRVALNLAHGAGYTFEGTDPNYLSAYPYMLAPAFALWDGEAGYRAALVLNALVMHLAAVPAFLLARRVATFRWALAAAAAAVLTPAMAWSGFLLTESLAYPLAALALYAMVRALERPALGPTIAALAACAAAAVSRAQLFALFGVFALALAADVLRAGPGAARARLAERHVPALALGGLAALAAAVVVAGATTSVLGTYSGVLGDGARPGLLAELAAKYVGVVAVSSLLLPVLAPVLLALRRGPRTDAALGPLLCVALAAVVVLVPVGAWSSAAVSPELRERYVFYATPALAACWAALPGRVSARRVAIATVVAFAYLLLVPTAGGTEDFTHPSVGDLLARIGLPRDVPLGGLDAWAACALVVGIAFAAGLALRGRPRVTLVLLMLPTLAFGFGTLHVRQSDANRESRAALERWPQPPDWIDRTATGPVGFVMSAGTDREALWQMESWNVKLDRVFRLPDHAPVSGVGQVCALEVGADGQLTLPEPCAGRALPRWLVLQDARAPLTLANARLVREGRNGVRLYEVPVGQAPRLAPRDARRVRRGARSPTG